jgi:hypothetical protein
MFLTRRGTSEGSLDAHARPYMVFYRDDGGELLLVGVATPLRDRMQLHFLDDGTRRTGSRAGLIALANDPALVLARARTI